MKSRSLLLVLVLLLAAVVYFVGVRPRQAAEVLAAGRARTAEHPSVSVILAERATGTRELVLPATLQAFDDTAIHARASGYLGKWLVDIGDHVKAGQVLAKIDSPEIDQELRQERANLDVANANLELARVTAERWKALGTQNAVAQQDVDQRVADYASRRADVAAAQANLQRLNELQQFETITAPFAGVITARNIDVGDLINAGSGPELFHISQSNVLRVYVNVPQADVPDMRVGLPVDVLVEEFPSQQFPGKVVRFAGALDAASRTLLVEAQIPNAQAQLFPGMFCRLRFQLPSDPAILIPSSDAIIRAEGTLVATVTDQNAIHFEKVALGRDFGTRIEIRSGLAAGTRVVENPSDALSEGEAVEPVPLAAPAPVRAAN
jgi:membrane fusion protein (multidrug efflux system)